MPDVLWRLFADNRPLADALPAIAASIIESWMIARHGLRTGVMAILHTFNGRLEFNSHVHTMVFAGGLHASSGSWISSVYCNNDQLMKLWRNAVIKLLREAHRAGLLRTEMTFDQMEGTLTQQAGRWWSIKVQSFKSKEHFLRYAGRYVRRPPIAQRRITLVGKRRVTFWAKDKKLGRIVNLHCSPEEFVERWARHIPEHYRHAMRSFGLFAPRVLNQASAAIFVVIGQQSRPRPRSLRWADSLERQFGRDPLLDETGNRMRWARQLAPQAPS